jgi:formylglycine-generating enzyme required for sulfatase activity
MKSPLSDELTQELAQQQIKRFVARFEPSYEYLACHCALPLVLTPELVNYIRVQFLLNEEVPWIAEADLLLSELCRPVGYELYAMSPAVRSNLLAQFQEPEFQQKVGTNRLKSVAQLLMDYVTYLMRTHPATRQAELQAQRWAAMVYLDEHRTKAEEEIATALQELVNRGKNGQAELARLQRLIEEYRPQLSQYDSLIEFAKSLGIWLKGQIPPDAGQSYAVHGVTLRLPTPTPTPELKTILLVEDQTGIITQISELLSSQYGIIVRGTENVNEVIALAQSGSIDLILINYELLNSYYQDKRVNGIEIVRFLKANQNISQYLPIIGFSVLVHRKSEFLQYADGFYDKNKVLRRGAETDFIYYLRKIFNRVKLTEILPYESAEDLDLVIDFISKQHLEGKDTSEEEIARLHNKPKGDDGTYYLLENLCLLGVLHSQDGLGKEPGTIRYDLSPSYLNQQSPKPYPPPQDDEFDRRIQQLHLGQRKLLDLIKNKNSTQQTTSQADAAVLFNHPEEGDLATYRRLEHLRLLGFLTITNIGTSRETLRYNLSPEYQKYLSGKPHPPLLTFTFETVTVNSRGKIIKRETKTAQYFSENLGNNITLEMVYIPSGTFMMGSPEGEGYDSEKPQHQVTVPPFFMSKFQITQAQWRAIASRTDLKVERDLDPNPAYFKDREDSDRRPVEQVSWYDAVEFCQRLSKQTGKEYRLPSEAEWEYACRAGTTTPFHFGETITTDLANYNGNYTYASEPKGKYREETTPVGSFPPNAFGLYDMHGNVWEWCADTWHDDYEGAPTDGSAWIQGGDDNRSPLRGGVWYYGPGNCRSAYRVGLIGERDDVNDGIGFRLVCGVGSTLLYQS